MNVKIINICLLAQFMLLFSNSHGQIKKSSIILGGNIFYSTSKFNISIPTQESPQQRSLIFSPSFGKGIRKNLILGANLNLQYTVSKVLNNALETKNASYGLGAFVRKYENISAKFYMFLQGNLYYNYEKNPYHRSFESETIKGPSFGLSIYPGVSYSLTKRLHFEVGLDNLANLYFLRQLRLVVDPNNNITLQSKMNVFSLESNLNNTLNFSLGFRLLFNK